MSNSFSYISLIFISFYITFTYSKRIQLYEESYNTDIQRLQFGKDHAESVTQNKVDFDYDKHKGVFCRANKNLQDKEFTFRIPTKYIVCAFDMFPFKFELKDAIFKSLSDSFGPHHNETKTKSSLYLFAYHLMLIHYENRTQILDEVKQLGKTYYITEPTKEVIEYIESLPKTLYTSHMYDEEEFRLFFMLGYGV
jgi:hypothetical protein